MSKRKKNSGRQQDRTASVLNLVAAIINLVTVILIALKGLLD